MMRKPYLNLFISFLFLNHAACHAQPHPELRGSIWTDKDWKRMVYLIQPNHFSEIAADYLGQVIDSSMIDEDGFFAFRHIPVLKEKTLVLFVVQENGARFPNHLMNERPTDANYMPMVLSNQDRITISADITHFQKTFTVNDDSGDNKIMLALRDTNIAAFQKFLNSPVKQDEDSLLLERERAYRNYLTVLMQFVDSTKYLEAALVAIRWISPTGDFERDPEFLIRQCEKWSSLSPQNTFVKELCNAAAKNKLPVLIGDRIPDVTLPMANGDTLMLSTQMGSSLTILDIWASWCAPCRKENREVLAPLFTTYKNKGFQIIGYSMDSNDAAWKEGIAKDGVTWPQASHLQGDTSPFLNALRITTIPANFILDHDGKIIAKNLFGEELSAYVREFFQR